jgi:hypothetical protein
MDRPLGPQKFEAPRLSTQSAHDGGKVVSPIYWKLLHPRKDSWYLFLVRKYLINVLLIIKKELGG